MRNVECYAVLHCPYEQEETFRLLHTIRGGSDSRRQQSPGGRASRSGGVIRAKGGEKQLLTQLGCHNMQKTVLLYVLVTSISAAAIHAA